MQEVELLVQFCNASTSEQVRVKCIGTLECLAHNKDSTEGNNVCFFSLCYHVVGTDDGSVQTIAEYLLTLLPTAAPPPLGVEPLVQAVSALIDIYSDETWPYDVNFRQGGYLERLSGSIDSMKKLVKSIDKRKPGGRELRLRGEEVRDNLVAFVKYRQSLKL